MIQVDVRISPEVNIVALRKFGQWWEQREKQTEKSQISTDVKQRPNAA